MVSSPTHRVKRQPDSSAVAAIAQVLKNGMFKRLMMFGLRSLSDLCFPPTIRFKENSIAALEGGVVAVIAEAIKADSSDEERGMLGCRIFLGMTEGLKEEANSLLNERFIQEGAIDTIVLFLSSGVKDDVTLDVVFKCIQNIADLGFKFDSVPLCKGLFRSLGETPKTKTKAKITLQLMSTLTAVVSSNIEAAAYIAQEGIPAVLDYCLKLNPTDKDSYAIVEQAMKVVKECAATGKASPDNLTNTMKLMDSFKGKKTIIDYGSAAIASMVGPEELKNSLHVLSTAKEGSEERKAALTMLSSMSYIASYAEAIVKAGSLPLLYDAWEKSAAEISKSSKDPRVMEGFVGSSKMLAAIARDPRNIQAVEQAGGLKAALVVLSTVKEKPEATAACCGTLAPMSQIPTLANQMMSSGAVASVLEMMQKFSKEINVVEQGAAVLVGISSHAQIAEQLSKMNIFPVITEAMKASKYQQFQVDCVTTLKNVSRYITSAKPLKTGGTLQAVVEALSSEPENVPLAQSASALFANLSTLSDSSAMADPTIVDAILSTMLSHSDERSVQDHCKAVLEVIATDNDVARTLADLEKALIAANKMPDRAIKVLAAVCGLSQMARLRTIFEKQNASATVLKGIEGWISNGHFKDQQKMISKGVQCVYNLNHASSGNLNDVLQQLLQNASSPQMKSILDKQDHLDNSALDILRSVQSLASLNRVETDAGLEAVIDDVLKVMKKFPDMRQIQVVCIDILNELTTARGSATIFSQSGALKIVIAYMQKVAVYEDVQIAGFRFLYNCIRLDPSMVDIMKRNGAVEVARSATRTYGNVNEVKVYLAPIAALLMPEKDSEQEIEANLRIIQKGALNEESVILQAMHCMGQLTLSASGSRCAVRLGVAQAMCEVMSKSGTIRDRTHRTTLLAETSVVMKHLTETRPGCIALSKAKGIEAVCGCIDELMTAPDSDAKRDGLENCALILGALVEAEPLGASEIAFKNNVVTKMMKLKEMFPNNVKLYGAAGNAIAAMRHKQLATLPIYQTYLDGIVAGIGSGDRERRLQCLGELENLLKEPDVIVLERLMEKQYINALFKVMDDFADDPLILRQAQRCVEEFFKSEKLLQKWMNRNKDNHLPLALTVTKRVIKKNKSDPDICAASTRILNRYCKASDKSVLQQSGIMSDIEELIALYPDHQALHSTIGELLRKMGSDELINHLMKQIIDTVGKGEPGWAERLKVLCNNLAVHLSADVENPEKALALAQKCADALADAIKKDQEASVVTAAFLLSRRLVEKFWNNDVIYGARAVEPKLMPQIARVIGEADSGSPASRGKMLFCHGFRTLAGCLNNPHTRGATLDVVRKNQLLSKCDALLKVYADDPTVVTRILDFMAQVGQDKNGANALVAEVKPRSRNIGEDFVNDIAAILVNNRKNPTVLQAGMELISNLLNTHPVPPRLTNPQFLKELERIADASPEVFAAHTSVQSRLIGKISNDDCCMNMKMAISKLQKIQGDQTLNAEQKELAAVAVARMIGEYADAGLMDELKKCGAVDALTQILEENSDSLAISNAIVRASQKVAKDQDMSAKLLRQNGDLYLNECAALAKGDAVASRDLVNLLKTLAETEGNGQILAQNSSFKNLKDTIAMDSAGSISPEVHALNAEMAQLSKIVKNAVPEVLTLKGVFEKWSARLAAGETLNLVEATGILSQFDFVVDYTEDYSKEPHKSLETELATEFMFGCKCFQLLHQYPENSKFCIEKKEYDFMLTAIRKQRNEHVDQYPILVSRDACEHRECAEAFAAVPNSALIIADALQRGRQITGVSNMEREELLIPRLVLVERIAYERLYFNNTEAMAGLIGLWDDYNSGKYSTTLLRHVFRSMRRIINDHFVPIILQNDVPKRLIDLVNKKDADPELLPDVLFLLGTLSSVPEIKTMIGELRGVEACLELLRRCLKKTTQNTSGIKANACLALSNITVGHAANIMKFTAAKGHELNDEVMRKSMEKTLEYDVANGASILMCNTCFKRDDQKELYGKKGAPMSVMYTIKKYDGSDDKSALRCLNSMFKAIGNLALYPPNVTEFLNGGIEQTLVHFYTHSENIPDNIIETSLRTVSNLVLENTEEAMIRFGVLVVPLLHMLRKGNRDTLSMLSRCFETLGCLCRLPENARCFAENEGIETVLKILNNECDESLYSNGIFVLGIQTTNPASIEILVERGIYKFLTALFEQQIAKVPEIDQEFEGHGCMVTDLLVGALRCVRRLLIDNHSGSEFISAGGLTTLCGLAAKTDDHSMIHLECYRVLINLLELNPPPEPLKLNSDSTRVNSADEWYGDVLDEGVLPAIALADRPPNPRSWESIGFQPTQVSDLIANICTILSKEENAKLQRLFRFGLGLLAYFACEKINGTVESFYSGGANKAIESALENFEVDSPITQTCCYIINNVCFASDPAMYRVMRKDKKMRANLDLAIKKIPKGEKQIKDFCTLTEKLLGEKSLDPTRFSVHHQWDYPLKLTQWDKDPYPNGVQDLPLDTREEIRAGGKFKVIFEDGTRETFHWKASFDLLFLQYRIDPKEGNFTESIPIARIKSIGKGLASHVLRQAAEKSSGVNRIWDTWCCVLSSSSGPDLPDGVELNIICGSKRARDRFIAFICEWRDAASYGF